MIQINVKKEVVVKHLQEIIVELIEVDAEALSLGVIDLSNAGFIALENKVEKFSRGMLEALSASAVMMFRGPEISRVESFICNNSDMVVENSLKEMYFSTGRINKFFKVVEGWDLLIVLVSRSDGNMALNWLTVKKAAKEVGDRLAELYKIK